MATQRRLLEARSANQAGTRISISLFKENLATQRPQQIPLLLPMDYSVQVVHWAPFSSCGLPQLCLTRATRPARRSHILRADSPDPTAKERPLRENAILRRNLGHYEILCRFHCVSPDRLLLRFFCQRVLSPLFRTAFRENLIPLVNSSRYGSARSSAER